MSSREKSFRRKIAYLVAIAVLLIPLFWLGHPATTDSEKPSGGILARLRADPQYGLSQKHLGQIDATGETIKLATLGLRGVAANILWGKTYVYKMKKDWTNLEATVLQLTKLQPNFITPWIFHGWNLSYNVSAEFDGYQDRYRYVIKGVNFLEQGIQYNQREPRLPWEVGWILSHKIGRADESKQFRPLFKADDDFHDAFPLRVPGPDPRDNWLVGKAWFREAEEMVDTLQGTFKGNLMQGRPGMSLDTGDVKLGKSRLVFRSSAPMCQMNYADALQVEGRFGEWPQQAWKIAAEDWEQYGWINFVRTPQLTADGLPVLIPLNDLDRGKNYQGQIEKITQQLRALEPGLREKIKKEKEAKLSDRQRQAVKTLPLARTPKQRAMAEEAEQLLEVTHQDLAQRITDPKKRALAVKLWRDLRDAEKMAGRIRRKREIVNFDYWRLRTDVEQTDEATAAHELIHEGDRALSAETSDLVTAKENYDKGLAAWRKVLDKFPATVTNETFGEDLMEVIQRYRRLLDLRDEKDQRKATYGKDSLLFSVGTESQDELDSGLIPADLRREFDGRKFDGYDVSLSNAASVSTDEQGSTWTITDQTAVYKLRKKADTLNVFWHFILSDIVELHGEKQPSSAP